MYQSEETEQIDEVAPLVAGLAGKAAGALAGKAATGAAAKAGGGLAKAASSKLGQKAISAGSQAVGNKVTDKMTTKKEEVEAVLELLINEGVALNADAAIDIITHMSDEWYESLVEGILKEEA